MRQLEFERRHQALWQNFSDWLAQQARRRRKDDPPPVLADADVPAVFRQICAQLALAQARHYSPSLVDHLNQLVLAGHQQLYGAEPRFADQAFWRRRMALA